MKQVWHVELLSTAPDGTDDKLATTTEEGVYFLRVVRLQVSDYHARERFMFKEQCSAFLLAVVDLCWLESV
jgi:hypothetical protein